ncbi:hypothetical protein FQA39_LY17555 [Lamprigera yunnana]|nr:hypothetical protein FQA39_LY17555 [Lamprigera yunnana]
MKFAYICFFLIVAVLYSIEAVAPFKRGACSSGVCQLAPNENIRPDIGFDKRAVGFKNKFNKRAVGFKNKFNKRAFDNKLGQ